tara:strand:+ start:425 stop:1123 length:699 start_codon:yes stop_codon:yes gene_type:complete
MTFCFTKRSLLAALFLLPVALSAKVYSLIPGRGGSGGIEEVLKPKTFWDEPVVINDVRMSLKIGLVAIPIDVLLQNLIKFFPNSKFAANKNTLLIIQKQKDGSQKRVLLVYLGKGMPLLQFSIMLPKKLPENFKWPEVLPRTFDAKPKKYVALPMRNVWYGLFKTASHKEVALGEMSSSLEANGWKPLSSTLNSGKPATGEMFYRKDPPGIMIINCTEEGFASSFYHPVSKK